MCNGCSTMPHRETFTVEQKFWLVFVLLSLGWLCDMAKIVIVLNERW